MYIVDDICYAGNPCDNPRVIEAKPLVGGMMLLHFSTGELKLFDTTTLEGSAFDILADPEVFNAPRVEHGFVSWAEGTVDIAPEYLYEHGVTYYQDDDLLLAG
ncbi:DUF2442 domain-containing protein [Enorma sp.]|uniref:DUF2442 domain-containing protein n=1 Tax=Enorma sp. TaxID=1920692 RepID=UPI0025BAA6A7|nr:DUF2442 domain-containing protein [Enorma sp.]